MDMVHINDAVSLDPATDTITIHGIKYSMVLFQELGAALPIGVKFSVEERQDGVLVIQRHDD